MPLFSVSNEGRVFRLLTPHDGHSGCVSDSDCGEGFGGGPGHHEYVTWQELPYLGVELKQVSAGGRSVWAVGGDRQIYVYVHSVDLPIRIKEEAYENQRWLPLEGFSSRLLPTDRKQFSSEDGLVERKLENVRLPSLAWQWEESSWRVEASLNGQPLDVEGWTYAVDFPATYQPQKQWSSCVRRRKWVRHRVYAAVDAWSALEPLNTKDPTEEPFIDVNVGGQNIVGAPKGHLSVWAVTAKGRVLYRQGVDWSCPEGVCWEDVIVNGNNETHEVKQVGVGPMGDAWCILWDGRALVRAGVARDHLKGDFWVELEPPSPSSNSLPGSSSVGLTSAPLSQISVGQWGAWAVTVDGRVWYRRGVRNSGFIIKNEDSATSRLLGVSWVEMVGQMSVVSVGPNDQVWAIGLEDRHLYVRTGVLLPSEPTGKMWRRLHLPVAASGSISSRHLGALRKHKNRSRPRVCSTGSEGSLYSNEESLSSSASPVKGSKMPDEVHTTGNVMRLSAYRNRSAIVASGAMASAFAFIGNAAGKKPLEGDSSQSLPTSDVDSKVGDASESENESAFGHPQDSEEEWDDWASEEDAGFEEGTDGGRSNGDHYHIRPEPLWAWVSGGSCIVDPHQSLPWFSEAGLSNVIEDSTEGFEVSRVRGKKGSRAKDIWRSGILQLLRDRRNRETSPYKYERAVQIKVENSGSSWVKNGKAFCCLPYPPSSLEECFLELEWVCSQNESDKATKEDYGTLTILSPNRSRTMLQWNLSEIRCVACSKGWASGDGTNLNSAGNTLSPSTQESESTMSSKLYSHPRLAIHAMMVSTPLKLQFGSEKDLEDWTSTITSVCCQVQGIQGSPKPGSIWATTTHGELFVFDPSSLQQEQWENEGIVVSNNFKGEDESGHYAVEWSTRGKEPPYYQVLHNGMPKGSTVVIRGTVASKPKRFTVNLVIGSSKGSDRNRNVVLHFNPRFESDGTVTIVRNTMKDGSWQEEERNGEYANSFTPGQDFSLSIISTDDGFKIVIEGSPLIADNVSIKSTSSSSSSLAANTIHNLWFKHRVSPGAVTHLEVDGTVTVESISYASPHVIVNMDLVFWRQLGGHFRQVEASQLGVIWGIAYDGTAWIHTGGWGGAFLEGMGEESGSMGSGDMTTGDSSGSKVQAMSDTRVVYVYENQRWNPLTGYSSVGLPTDRPSWSDRSGRHHRSRDSTKLPSRHWHWATDWSVDFGVSGGVDSDGWQYAIDFPATYHASKGFTDYVRRRRWIRVAKLSTKGPWRPLPHTPLANISLHSGDDNEDGDGEGVVSVWAIAANTGEVLFRHGVTRSTPAGISWECVVGGEQPFICISCGGHSRVWAIGRNGAAYWRFGINSACPTGQVWVHVEPPPGHKLRQISVAECENGALAVWAIDLQGNLYMRKEMTPVFPEGTHWHAVVSGDHNSGKKQILFGHVSVGPGGEVWATSAEQGGAVLRRLGSYTADCPGDSVWSRGVTASWQYVSTHGWRCRKN